MLGKHHDRNRHHALSRIPRLAGGLFATALIASLATACSSSSGDGSDRAAPARLDTAAPQDGSCATVVPDQCLLPWPNDAFTAADSTRATGRRIDLPDAGLPVNAAGDALDDAEWDRNDGFSPSTIAMTLVPGVDLERSGLPIAETFTTSTTSRSALTVLDLDTNQLLPAWVELDAQADEGSEPLLRIVPAVGLTEGHHIAIGLRALVTKSGATIAPSDNFEKEVATRVTSAGTRAWWIDALEDRDIAVSTLTVAWGFTVASTDSLSGRLRSMVSEAEGGPVPLATFEAPAERDGFVEVSGQLTVPNYLTGTGEPGSVLNNGNAADGMPTRNGDYAAQILCVIPKSASADNPARMLLYGHGLLGSRSELLGLAGPLASANVGGCALDWIGMSSDDLTTVANSLSDLQVFRSIPDRLLQAHLNVASAARWLRDPAGAASIAPFADSAGAPRIDLRQLHLLGASQGGILGGASASVSADIDRVVLAVPGMGYNLLLDRSIDFDTFSGPFGKNYPTRYSRTIAVELMQMLWDRGENSGYVQHLTRDPFEGVPPKQVLLLEAFGDHQVANVSTEKLARTIGVSLATPTLRPGRSEMVDAFAGIPPIQQTPHRGSVLQVWDFGAPAPPEDNEPPRAGTDPHGALASEPRALAIVDKFLNKRGEFIDACQRTPCVGDS